MITASNFLTAGRLGNILYRYCSLIGLSRKYKHELMLPPWPESKYFEGVYPEGVIESDKIIKITEPVFHHTAHWPQLRESENVDILGYLQSWRYFSEVREEVKQALTFKQEFKDQCWDNFFRRSTIKQDFRANGKKTIALSVRRGDYISNENYCNLPITYFIGALFERYPEWREKNIIVFSDDTSYCRVHFSCLPNVYFSENNSAIEDLCLLSQCHEFILSNSTFSLFGALIAELQNPVKVVRPAHYFAGRLLRDNNDQDLWPKNWEIYDHLDHHRHNKKINLKDVCFTIPVYSDSEDRKENLDLCLKHLQRNFDTNILVQEQGGYTFEYVREKYGIDYLTFGSPDFHRTRMLNYMAAFNTQPFIANWDCDILIAPLQIFQAAEKLRAGADFVYPYDGRFARIPRNTWYTRLRDYEDIGIVGTTQFSGMDRGDAVSLGGACMWNKERFFELGGENEKMIGYCPEDVERYERAVKLGARIERVPGPMYHINHWVGQTSNTSNPHYPAGLEELRRIRSLTKEQLLEEVKTWPKGM